VNVLKGCEQEKRLGEISLFHYAFCFGGVHVPRVSAVVAVGLRVMRGGRVYGWGGNSRCLDMTAAL
jgi:hypothetical protein